MAPPNAEILAQEVEKIDLKQLARKKGRYLVYPETKVKFLCIIFVISCSYIHQIVVANLVFFYSY